MTKMERIESLAKQQQKILSPDLLTMFNMLKHSGMYQ